MAEAQRFHRILGGTLLVSKKLTSFFCRWAPVKMRTGNLCLWGGPGLLRAKVRALLLRTSHLQDTGVGAPKCSQ